MKLFITIRFLFIYMTLLTFFIVLPSFSSIDPFKPANKIYSKQVELLEKQKERVANEKQQVKSDKKKHTAISKKHPAHDVYVNMTVQNNNESIAKINDFMWIKVGEDVDGWLVKSIKNGCIILTDEEEIKTICIGQNETNKITKLSQ